MFSFIKLKSTGGDVSSIVLETVTRGPFIVLRFCRNSFRSSLGDIAGTTISNVFFFSTLILGDTDKFPFGRAGLEPAAEFCAWGSAARN